MESIFSTDAHNSSIPAMTSSTAFFMFDEISLSFMATPLSEPLCSNVLAPILAQLPDVATLVIELLFEHLKRPTDSKIPTATATQLVPCTTSWNNDGMTVSDADLSTVAEQLGRKPRGVVDIAYRTPDGQPAVIKTAPRLPDGTPFPTLYYLTDPRLTAEASRLEVAHIMKW